MIDYRLAATAQHCRWNRELGPQLEVESGSIVQIETLESTGGQLSPHSTLADFQQINRDRIHTLTGPIAVRGAQPGDALQVDVLAVETESWGWSSIVPGLGFLTDRFAEPYFFRWELRNGFSDSMAPAKVPLRPFCGIMGVAPAGSGEFRTRPPGPNGGNMDVGELTAGSSLFLPVFVPGALFSLGDVHAAQGQGEVCINGIECSALVTVRLSIRSGWTLSAPMIESGPVSRTSSGEWIMVESDPDVLQAARRATERMIDFLIARWGMTPEQAYLLCSVAMDLRFSQVVNIPVFTVTAALAKSLFQ